MTQTASSVDEWIARYLRDEEPKSKSLIVTVLGDSIAPRSAGIWLSELIGLMSPFGVNERLVRTSSFRLVDEHWLEPRREGRRSFYSLTMTGLHRLELAYERVYTGPQSDWSGSWTIVLLPRGSEMSPGRNELRRELEWEGFASLSPGVLIHPASKPAALRQILDNLGMTDRVTVMTAKTVDGFSAMPVDGLIKQCWDLDDAKKRYLQFVALFEPLLGALNRVKITHEQSFMAQTLLIHSFRRASLHDPRLPTSLLPNDWPGARAFELCDQVYRRTYRATHAHLLAFLGDAGPLSADSKAAFSMNRRFGGLKSV